MNRPLEVVTLTDGGQRAEDVAERLLAFLAGARRTLDVALYDVRLPGAVGDAVAGAIRAAAGRGVAVRIAYNQDHPGHLIDPPPPRTQPSLLETLGVPLAAVPGVPDLMHHKYAVRDGQTVWTGSTNWTLDSWEREENVLLVAASPALAAAYLQDFEELWRRREVQGSGAFDAGAADGMRPWFCPGRGPQLSERIGAAIARARRVRIASPVLTAGPVLRALSSTEADVAGVVDATQVDQVFAQWSADPHARWKVPVLRQVLDRHPFGGKRSTPYTPGSVHDFMHAKVTVCDDVVFTGSFNLSRSGEQNAENVLEIGDPALADRLAGWIDELRARYAP